MAKDANHPMFQAMHGEPSGFCAHMRMKEVQTMSPRITFTIVLTDFFMMYKDLKIVEFCPCCVCCLESEDVHDSVPLRAGVSVLHPARTDA